MKIDLTTKNAKSAETQRATEKAEVLDHMLGEAVIALNQLCECCEHFGDKPLAREAETIALAFMARQRTLRNLRSSASSAVKETEAS
jgi:hypothetical protein